MKIKTDFVTNSSSTSFILIASEKFKKNTFLEAAGIQTGSEIYFLFEKLYESIEKEKKPIEECKEDHETARLNALPDDIKQKISKAQEKGNKVYMGFLSSESELEESFFCMDSFIIEGESFYFNAIECAW